MASKQSAAPTTVSGSTYGAIHASCSDLWMIRLPNRLASAWEDASEGTVLGTLTFVKGGGKGASSGPPSKRLKTGSSSSPPASSKISIMLDSNIAESQADLPINYTLEAMTKKTPGALHPFTRNADGGVTVHGLVSRMASAQVAGGSAALALSASKPSDGRANDANAARYRTLLRNRLLETTVNSKRFVRPGGLDAATSGPAGSSSGRPSAAATAAASLGTGFGGSVARFGKRMMDAQERAAQERAGYIIPGSSDDKKPVGPVISGIEGVRSSLFEFFSKKRFWTVRELRLASGGRLPERETREVLREIAEYHRTGEHKNMWELKAEFRSAATLAAASTPGSGEQKKSKDDDDDDDDED